MIITALFTILLFYLKRFKHAFPVYIPSFRHCLGCKKVRIFFILGQRLCFACCWLILLGWNVLPLSSSFFLKGKRLSGSSII